MPKAQALTAACALLSLVGHIFSLKKTGTLRALTLQWSKNPTLLTTRDTAVANRLLQVPPCDHAELRHYVQTHSWEALFERDDLSTMVRDQCVLCARAFGSGKDILMSSPSMARIQNGHGTSGSLQISAHR